MAYICVMCDKPEKQCQCARYCTVCKSDYDVRLCHDGCYYCQVCREVCELTPED